MRRVQSFVVVIITGALASLAQAQPRPYIGFVYPAGGRQGSTFEIRVGGQGLDGVRAAQVSGKGVEAKVFDYMRRLNNQELVLLREQLKDLVPPEKENPTRKPSRMPAEVRSGPGPGTGPQDPKLAGLIARIERRINEFVATPACNSISSLVLVEVTVAPGAEPGPRQLTLTAARGVSNPLVFHVGQLPEISRKPMVTATLQVLGKEEMSLRKRPAEEIEQRVALPCTLNGQIASGEVNRYRFEARRGQRLVFSTQARQLVPFIADAVPGWFQPVMALYDAKGKEVAYNDDYRFQPDPVIFYEVPQDGEYALAITDALYRGREDFVYRITAGELPFVTGIFPLGRRAGRTAKVEVKGWNVPADAPLTLPPADAPPGVYPATVRVNGMVSNPVPFAVDTLPECREQEPNNDMAHAQKLTLPAIVNGRIDRPGEWDVFRFQGRAGQTIVAEVSARRLDSPLDSVLKLTDASGKVLAYNDDYDDPEAGTNTHPADSYLSFKLPADGTYFVHLGDTARHGGEEYAYRLRIGPPRPDFALLAVPSNVSMPSKGGATVAVQLVRKDGFAGPVKIGLKDPPAGFIAGTTSLSGTQTRAGLWVKTTLAETPRPLPLRVEGRAVIEGKEVVRAARPAEDRMQAFLWRHLVPADELELLVFSPQTVPKRLKRPVPSKTPPATPDDAAAAKAKLVRQQLEFRIRQVDLLYDEGLLTESFRDRKIAECEAAIQK